MVSLPSLRIEESLMRLGSDELSNGLPKRLQTAALQKLSHSFFKDH
jgi:hypothetical protein